MPPKKSPRTSPKAVIPKKATKVKVDPIAELRASVAGTKVAKAKSFDDDDIFSHVTDFVSTASIALDHEIKGGFPCGRITEFFAEEGVGKSTIAAHAMSSVQREGGIAILIDTEGTADKKYLKAIGVDTEKLQVISYNRGEMSIESIFEVIRTIIDTATAKFPDTKVLIVWDSVAATPSAEEMKKNVGEAHGAKPARSIKAGIRYTNPFLGGTKIGVLMINHMYTQVGAFSPSGPKKVVYGGKGIPHAATLRLRGFRLGAIKSSDGVIIGQKIGIKVEKIKNGDTWGRVAEVAILSGVGIDNVYTIFESFKKRGIIVVGGAGWYGMQIEGEEPLRWQGGFQGLGVLCREKSDLFGKLVAIWQHLESGSPMAVASDGDD